MPFAKLWEVNALPRKPDARQSIHRRRAHAPRPCSCRLLEGTQTPRDMVATANPLASAAAVEMLKEGGNAVDAAVAAPVVLGLVEPQSSGLGGGAFLMFFDARRKRVHAIDGREKGAPPGGREPVPRSRRAAVQTGVESRSAAARSGFPARWRCCSRLIAAMAGCLGAICSPRRSAWRSRDCRVAAARGGDR